jgi:hypothetical protein
MIDERHMAKFSCDAPLKTMANEACEGWRAHAGQSVPANCRSIAASGIKHVTCLFMQTDRLERSAKTGKTDFGPLRTGHHRKKEEGMKMKKLGFASIIASGLTAAVVGLAAPASAGVDHLGWLNDIHQHANAPQVSSSVQQSR